MHKANHPAARGNGVVNYRSLIECSSSPKLGAKTTASVPEHSGWERPDIVRGRMLVPRRSDNSSWQMVAPPQACHRSGSADRTARFLGHLVLALAHPPSRRRGCLQLAERSVGSPCCRLSDRFRVSLLDDGALGDGVIGLALVCAQAGAATARATTIAVPLKRCFMTLSFCLHCRCLRRC